MAVSINEIEDVQSLSDDDFIKKHERLVHFVIKRYRKSLKMIKENTGMEYEDLTQIGNIGLLKARKGFNPDLGWKFSTYAAKKIWGQLQAALRDSNKMKIPRGTYETRNTMLKKQIYNEDPEVIADILDVPLERVKYIKANPLYYISFDQEIGSPDDNREKTLGDVVADERSTQYLKDIEDSDVVRLFLSTLSDKERTIWSLHSDQKWGQTDIGKEVGISQAQVSRLLRAIKGKAVKFGRVHELDWK